MSRIRGKDTGPERTVSRLLADFGIPWESHARDLPGRPDFAFRDQRVAVFVDGDFWHGWRFPVWRVKLTPFWEAKIAANRARDSRNHRKLRQAGWTVVRIWEHQIEADEGRVIARLRSALGLPTW